MAVILIPLYNGLQDDTHHSDFEYPRKEAQDDSLIIGDNRERLQLCPYLVL